MKFQWLYIVYITMKSLFDIISSVVLNVVLFSNNQLVVMLTIENTTSVLCVLKVFMILWNWLDADSYFYASVYGWFPYTPGWNVSSFQWLRSSQIVCVFRWQFILISCSCIFFYNWIWSLPSLQAHHLNPSDWKKSKLEELSKINKMTRFIITHHFKSVYTVHSTVRP